MRFTVCSQERAVLWSVSTGDWPPGLREHAARCPACREVALVSLALVGLKDPVALPDPHRIWWRARWLESHAAAERAAQPIILYRRCAAAVAAVGVGVLAFLGWPQLSQWLAAWQGQWTLFGLAVPVIALAAVAGLGGLLALRAALAED